ncbi:LysR family transcriptional regulator [Desmospora activa]|uniref:DNA-binding transcriptional LysR family regulator n=1 Tax=Desmospora activa DSM 45169 TaxID=1121389 RepID=A0A2T4ZAZ2_9BACL|nr:LysR family transcriptional regulator [Desmospora activa]PTM59050.1 DNA-binding transcriptional LysR family regulator [Desmospora activa DSM 45169]
MNDQDWRILTTLYKEKNITKTAEKLCISQPALTYRLRQMENEFNITIAYRGRRGVEFTAEGEYLVKYAQEMLLQLRNTKEQMWNMDTKVQGILRLGVSSIFARYKLPLLLKHFRQQYPDVEIKVSTGWSEEVMTMVYKQDVHIGIIRGEYKWPDQKYLLMEEPLYVVSKEAIELEELPRSSRINYQTDSTLRTIIDHWWMEHYLQPSSITMEVDKMETCKEMVLHGLGYAILPGIFFDDSEELCKIPLIAKDGGAILRKTWMIYRKDSLKISAIRAFVAFMKEKKEAP